MRLELQMKLDSHDAENTQELLKTFGHSGKGEMIKIDLHQLQLNRYY